MSDATDDRLVTVRLPAAVIQRALPMIPDRTDGTCTCEGCENNEALRRAFTEALGAVDPLEVLRALVERGTADAQARHRDPILAWVNAICEGEDAGVVLREMREADEAKAR